MKYNGKILIRTTLTLVWLKREQRLKLVNLDLTHVVKVNVLLRDVWDIPIMEDLFKDRFKGKFPARKNLATEFAHRGGPEGLMVQIDGIAYDPR